MATTYTSHKLTPAQCRVLASFIAEAANPKHAHRHGVAAGALVRKGLIEQDGNLPRRRVPCCSITANGIEALEQARREGW